MPSKSPLMPAIYCPTRNYLESALAIYQMRGLLTQNQTVAILATWRPATFALAQRTAKSAVYVSIDGAPTYIVNNRSKVSIL
jgi:hypothetical protein